MKTKTIQIRVTEAGHDMILSRAVETGLSMSDYLRQLGISGGDAVSSGKIHDMIMSINKIGVNINQLARRANESGHTTLIYSEASELVSEFRSYLYRIMNKAEGSK